MSTSAARASRPAFLRLPRVERGDCVYHLASDLAV